VKKELKVKKSSISIARTIKNKPKKKKKIKSQFLTPMPQKRNKKKQRKIENSLSPPKSLFKCKRVQSSRLRHSSFQKKLRDSSFKTKVREKSRNGKLPDFSSLNLFSSIDASDRRSEASMMLNSLSERKGPKKISKKSGYFTKRFSIKKKNFTHELSPMMSHRTSELETRTLKFEASVQKSRSRNRKIFSKNSSEQFSLLKGKKNQFFEDENENEKSYVKFLRVNDSFKTLKISNNAKFDHSFSTARLSSKMLRKGINVFQGDKKMMISILFLKKKFDMQKLKAFLKIKFAGSSKIDGRRKNRYTIKKKNFMERKNPKKNGQNSSIEKIENFPVEKFYSRGAVEKVLISVIERKTRQKLRFCLLKLKINKLLCHRRTEKEINPLTTLSIILQNIFQKKMKNNFQIFQEVILSKSLLPISQMKKSDAKESSL